MEQTMIDNLYKNTGKTLEEWIEIVNLSGFEKHGEVVKHLKEKHGFTHGFANLVAHKAKGSDAGSATDSGELVDKQYEGRENLRQWYEQVTEAIKQFGSDVEIAPKNNYVSIRRKKQFALVQPSTKTRLDIGLNLKDRLPEGNLEASGSFSAMCTHRVKVTQDGDINADLIQWLRQAYDMAG